MSKQKVSSENEMLVAYYVAKWNFNGLAIKEQELKDSPVGKALLKSLRVDVPEFQAYLGLTMMDDSKYNEKVFELGEELKNLTCIQVRAMVNDFISSELLSHETSTNNRETAIKARNLNAQEQVNYENNIEAKKKVRRLTYLGRREN